jgi:acyl-CoA reductase-like NAD-dependent aldehyde dehydrogenase
MTITDVTTQPTDAERFNHILQAQRAAYLRDGAPSLAARRDDLHKLRTALIARRSAIEEAINTDFGHRSRHETAMMELVGVVQGIDYLERNLRRFHAALRQAPMLFSTSSSHEDNHQSPPALNTTPTRKRSGSRCRPTQQQQSCAARAPAARTPSK